MLRRCRVLRESDHRLFRASMRSVCVSVVVVVVVAVMILITMLRDIIITMLTLIALINFLYMLLFRMVMCMLCVMPMRLSIVTQKHMQPTVYIHAVHLYTTQCLHTHTHTYIHCQRRNIACTYSHMATHSSRTYMIGTQMMHMCVQHAACVCAYTCT